MAPFTDIRLGPMSAEANAEFTLALQGITCSTWKKKLYRMCPWAKEKVWWFGSFLDLVDRFSWLTSHNALPMSGDKH